MSSAEEHKRYIASALSKKTKTKFTQKEQQEKGNIIISAPQQTQVQQHYHTTSRHQD